MLRSAELALPAADGPRPFAPSNFALPLPLFGSITAAAAPLATVDDSSSSVHAARKRRVERKRCRGDQRGNERTNPSPRGVRLDVDGDDDDAEVDGSLLFLAAVVAGQQLPLRQILKSQRGGRRWLQPEDGGQRWSGTLIYDSDVSLGPFARLLQAVAAAD